MRKNKENENIPIYVAAELMGVSKQFIRIGLQRGLLPFGTAMRIGGSRYTYYISPQKFEEYTGISLQNKIAVHL